jgi:hypothetical protein
MDGPNIVGVDLPVQIVYTITAKLGKVLETEVLIITQQQCGRLNLSPHALYSNIIPKSASLSML